MKTDPYGLWSNIYRGYTKGKSLQDVSIEGCAKPTNPSDAIAFLRAWADAIDEYQREKAKREGVD